MRKAKLSLKGSKSRDEFKHWHKTLPSMFYALDIDFIFVKKSPPGIVAVLDYKLRRDKITFAECLAFNDLMNHYPIYIVRSETSFAAGFQRCRVYRYRGGDWRPNPPIVQLEEVATLNTPEEWISWERVLRAG